MTTKVNRDLIRMAEAEGMGRARIVGGSTHARLCGEVNGKQIEIVVSLTKSFMCQRNAKCVRLNIRKAVRAARGVE